MLSRLGDARAPPIARPELAPHPGTGTDPDVCETGVLLARLGPASESEAGSGQKWVFVVTQIYGFRFRRVAGLTAALLAFVMGEALGSRPVPGTPSGKRSAGTHRAVRVVCMPSERTARAAQLAPSAVTASAVGAESEDLPPERSVAAESLRRRAARRGARAIVRPGPLRRNQNVTCLAPIFV